MNGHKTAGTVSGFKMLGVPVRLHFTFILLVLFLLVTLLGSARSAGNYAVFLVGSLISVLLHEVGHAFVAARFGIRTIEIVMFPIGGLSRMERPLGPTAEVWVSLAGPLVNLLLAGGIFGYLVASHQATPVSIQDLMRPSDKSVLSLLLYGNVVLAIWGRETDYGRYRLPHNAIRVLATQAYIGRRK